GPEETGDAAVRLRRQRPGGRAARRLRPRGHLGRPDTARHRASRRAPAPVRGAQLTEIGNTSSLRWRENWRVLTEDGAVRADVPRSRARRRAALATVRA